MCAARRIHSHAEPLSTATHRVVNTLSPALSTARPCWPLTHGNAVPTFSSDEAPAGQHWRSQGEGEWRRGPVGGFVTLPPTPQLLTGDRDGEAGRTQALPPPRSPR